jgi:ornithine cyclodeaminase/alanine dehydrogenase-like protein (mu-crystallin family)
VAGFPSNAAVPLPAIHGSVVLNDALDGRPRAILDATAITAHRTAAVSGLAIERWGPRPGHPVTVALVGAGAQARSHLPVIAHLLPGANVVLCDRDEARARALAAEARAGGPLLGAFRDVGTASDPRAAVADAQLVVTVVSFGRPRQIIPEAAFGPDATIVAVDYDMCVPASVAASADLFLVDHREQYLANRTETVFAGYPEPMATLGEAIHARTPRRGGRVLVTHLGVGLADVVFADALLRRAEGLGIGTILEP